MNGDNSPIKKAAYFMVFMFLVAILVFWKSYYPYYRLQKLIEKNDCETFAVVIEPREPVKEDFYYYGPVVEFTLDNGIRVRSETYSTVKSSTKFYEGDKVTIRYNGEMNSDVIIASDDGPRRRCITLCIVAAVIAFIGLVDFIVHTILALREPKGKTVRFKTSPDGKSFKEWQETQRLADAPGEAEKALPEDEKAPEAEK